MDETKKKKKKMKSKIKEHLTDYILIYWYSI